MATVPSKRKKENTTERKKKHEKCFCIHTMYKIYIVYLYNTLATFNNNNNTTQKDK